jgi:hypothetical protein
VKRKALITLILGTTLAIAPAAHAVVLSADSGGAGGGLAAVTSTPQPADGWMSSITAVVPSNQSVNPATQALLLRSEGLATHYGVSPATQAVMLRSTGLANYYGSRGVTFRPDILGGDGGVPTATPTATGGDSFAWGTVGIAASTLIGVMLLGLAVATVTRRRHRFSF